MHTCRRLLLTLNSAPNRSSSLGRQVLRAASAFPSYRHHSNGYLSCRVDFGNVSGINNSSHPSSSIYFRYYSSNSSISSSRHGDHFAPSSQGESLLDDGASNSLSASGTTETNSQNKSSLSSHNRQLQESQSSRPRHHGYTYAKDAGHNTSSLSDDAIDALLLERVLARRRQDFKTSDRIRQTLNEAGVYVYDKQKEWRADGRMFDYVIPLAASAASAAANDSKSKRSPYEYIQSPDAGPNQCQLFSEADISKLLAERLQAKLNRDFAKADSIRNDLMADGVYINDSTKEWRADGVRYLYGLYSGINEEYHKELAIGNVHVDSSTAVAHSEKSSSNGSSNNSQSKSASYRAFGPQGHYYTLCQEAGPPTTLLSEREIHQLLAERLRYRVLRDFDNADRIREDLSDQGVHVDDQKKLWRADGVQFEAQRHGHLGKTRDFGPRGHDYTLAADAGPNTSGLDDETIHGLLSERLQAKMARDFAHADRIRDALDVQGVFIDDRRREWRADNVKFEFVGAIGGYKEEQRDDDAF